tara:strand:- start:24411 stop:24875 length:465 start_codon:yes stop_codon:yes gene_type:complete
MNHKTVAPPLPLNASNETYTKISDRYETYRDRSDCEGVPISEMMARERRVPASASQAEGLPYHRMMGTVEREPVKEVVYTAVQLREMIQRTNDYLANSTPEFAIVRQDRCQELEYFLIRTGNMNGYDFLDLNVKDASRRRYRFAPRLLVTSIGN